MFKPIKMYYWCVVLTMVLLSLGNPVFAQHLYRDTTKLEEHRTLLKFAGACLMFGNAPSSSGWFGASIIASAKNIEVMGGLGWNNVKKVHMGVAWHTDLQKEFCPVISAELVHSFKRGFVFHAEQPDERHYDAGSAQFIHSGVGLIWSPVKWRGETVTSLFLKIGYRQRISGYSLTPRDPVKADQAEMDAMFHDIFESGISWSIGIRWGLNPKNATTTIN